MANIQDFGQKIGGARKDEWRHRGLLASDLQDMNELERETYVKKDNVWPRPNWEEVIANGTPQAVAYWQNKMRQAIPPKPAGSSEERQENYIKVVSSLRDDIMAVCTMADVKAFYDNVLIRKYTHENSSYGYHYIDFLPETNGIIDNKFRKAARGTYRLEEKAQKELFGVPKDKKAYTQAKQNMSVHHYDGEETTLEPFGNNEKGVKITVATPGCRAYYYIYHYDKFSDINEWQKDTYFVVNANRKPLAINMATQAEAEALIERVAEKYQEEADKAPASEWTRKGNARKKNFIPPQLSHVQYTGPKYRGIRKATGDMYLKDLKFRAGEFGNWMNHDDRQASLNMGYDALRNLADLLNIRKEDVSLNGKLAIAFGARGKGGANAGAAHYEPLRQVINLTKMSGAGCLAHEWGHALDHAIGMMCGGTGFATEATRAAKRDLPESFRTLCESLKTKQITIAPGARNEELEAKLAPAISSLKGWINSVKPSDLPPPAAKEWDEAMQYIIQNTDSFNGFEYLGYSAYPGTHPYVEVLSQIRKTFTNHVVPLDAKKQIVLWSREINRIKGEMQHQDPTIQNVQTDFYKGSQAFDKIYSKMGQGYWASSCEMFARAFDCYIADKLKEQGIRSDFLTSNADSFAVTEDGKTYYAYPRGEERKALNAAFDELIRDLKEREFLHDAPVIEEQAYEEPEHKRHSSFPEPEPGKVHYEQLSLDELLFSAESRAKETTAASPSRKKNDISR